MPSYIRNKMNAARGQSHCIQVISILLLLTIMGLASWKSKQQIDKIDTESTAESLACLRAFNDKDCNPYSPSEDCANIIACAQRDKSQILNNSLQITSTFLDHIQRYSALPVSLMIVLLLFKIKNR